MHPEVRLFGRSSSHFTRVAAIFAHELAVPFQLEVVHEITSLDAAIYGGHPALKIPTLRAGASLVFGAENICRKLTGLAGRAGDPRVVFAEAITADTGRCAQELVWHAMAAQVQLVVGTVFARLPPDNVFFAKASAGLQGALAWLDDHVAEAFALLPADRDLSIFEVTLFSLVEHLSFRPTVDVERYQKLRRFAAAFALRDSARRTAFTFDPVPLPENHT